MPIRRGRKGVGQIGLADQRVALGRRALERVRALRKQSEQVLERLVVERRFGALEEQLGDPLHPHAARGSDVENHDPIGIEQEHLVPSLAVEEYLNPAVAVGVVDLEKELGLV